MWSGANIMFSHEIIIKKTRKDHKCRLCHKTVSKGSEMQKFFVSDDGEINSGRNCMECVDFITKHPEIFDNMFVSENDIIEYMIVEGYLKRG